MATEKLYTITTPSRARALRLADRDGGFFGGADRRARFGWLHRPAHATGAAVVIVPPFGYEAICAHRALRHLADAAARAGMLAVRFDLDGTGDSAGDDLDGGRLEAWLSSIADACDLARSAGADRLVLVGIRLGATLATLAAVRRDDVAGVVAVAAVPSGKALVREGRALQLTLGLPPPPDGATASELQEVVGFALSDETRDALAELDLAQLPRHPAPAVMVIDRDDLPANDAWVAALRGLGAEVTHRRLPGYVEMVLDPHRTEVPRAIIDATLEHAAALPAIAGVGAARRGVVTATAELGAGTEERVQLDDQLVAIASVPRGGYERAVILLNAGAVHHVGPNRLYVALARELAARGVLALRVDQAGIGDSAPRPGAAENVVYSEHAIADVGAAVAWVRARGSTHVTVVGLCSGAYHALKAAGRESIDAVVPINPLTFAWRPDMPLDLAPFRITSDVRRYRHSVRSIAAWRKLLRGDVDLERLARVVATRLRATVARRIREGLRRLHVPLRDLGSELAALARNGTAIHFVFAADDPGRAMLAEEAGSVVDRLARAGTLAIDVIENADHTFTPRWSHPLLIETVIRAATQ